MRVVRSRNEEPANQTHEELFTSPLGLSVTRVVSTFADGQGEIAIYLDLTESPSVFDVIGVYDNTPSGQGQSESTAFIAIRILEVQAELKNRDA
jgi:hypothetical protein